MIERILAASLLAGLLALAARAQTQVDLRTQAKDVDFSASSSTKPFQVGTALPANCAVGAVFFNSAVPAGQNVYGCTAANVWTLESTANGLPSMTGAANQVLSNNGTAAAWQALGGDIGGAPQAVVVDGIQGHPVAAIAPSDGQLLAWSATANQWEPYTAAAASATNYSQSFTAQTTITIPGTAHEYGTANLLVECYDNNSPAHAVEPDSVTIDPATFNVTVNFTNPQSGRCVLNGVGGVGPAATSVSNTFVSGTVQQFLGALVATGSDRTAPAKAGTALPPACTTGDQFFNTAAAAGQNLYFCTAANTWTQMSGVAGGGSVSSVFGRTGAIAAQSGDYSFSQLSGTVTDSQVAAGINASKIGAGTVSNTALGYLANVSSDIQAQLNSKAAVGAVVVGGDVSGTTASETVVGIRGRAVSAAVPADGQALAWSAAANAWQPGTAAGGGAGMAAQLGDFQATQTGSKALTVGGSCSSTTPCNVRFGNTVYSFTQSCTATIGAGSGTAYIYIANGGVLTVGHNLTVTPSSGCVAQSGVTSFPYDSVPLFTWTATSATWDTGGGRDLRGWLSTKNISAGVGVTTVESGGRTTIGVDTAAVPTFLTAAPVALSFPAIANGSCVDGPALTVPGANPGDAVAAGWPSMLEAGLVGNMRVSAANTVTVRLCNLSGAPVTPSASETFGATIVRSF